MLCAAADGAGFAGLELSGKHDSLTGEVGPLQVAESCLGVEKFPGGKGAVTAGLVGFVGELGPAGELVAQASMCVGGGPEILQLLGDAGCGGSLGSCGLQRSLDGGQFFLAGSEIGGEGLVGILSTGSGSLGGHPLAFGLGDGPKQFDYAGPMLGLLSGLVTL
jgi:hypothetical protein